MAVLAELRDPWSVLLALAAGAAVVWFAPWPIAMAVVAAVLTVRLTAGRIWPTATPVLTLASFDRGPGGKLTKREVEVAALVAEHLTNKQIAARLFIEEKTVDNHVEHIFGKLDMNRRSQIVEWWRRRSEVVSRQPPTG